MTPSITPFQIIPYNEAHRAEVVAVWEASVRATHHFLVPSDVDYFKGIVATLDFGAFPVFCLLQEGAVRGFIGVAEGKVEMLFLDPAHIGQGHGKMLMHFAMKELGGHKVDVNEQNEHAVDFYRHLGFVVYGRTEQDASGKDYPILQMAFGTAAPPNPFPEIAV